jgi:hypothetical protein
LPFSNGKLLLCSSALAHLKHLIFKISDRQLDLLLEAIIGPKTCKSKQAQLRNNTPNNKGLKEWTGKGFGSKNANARNTKNGTIEGFEL